MLLLTIRVHGERICALICALRKIIYNFVFKCYVCCEKYSYSCCSHFYEGCYELAFDRCVIRKYNMNLLVNITFNLSHSYPYC